MNEERKIMDNQTDSIGIAGPSKRLVSPEYVDNVDIETLSKRRKVSEDSDGSKGFTAILTRPGSQNNPIIGGNRNNVEKSVCRYLKPLQSTYSNTSMLSKNQALPDSILSTNRPYNLHTNPSSRNMCLTNNTDKLKILTTTAEVHENSTCNGHNPSALTMNFPMKSSGGDSVPRNDATYRSTAIQSEETHSSSLPTVRSVSDTGNEHANSKTKQISYTPNVPMNKEQLTAWRREARRVRNRQSAAASRQKIRDRIEELESQVISWKRQYNDAIGKVEKLEQLVKQKYLSYSRK